jgi:undecaprenyl pyrophosphate phosphatase UppP
VSTRAGEALRFREVSRRVVWVAVGVIAAVIVALVVLIQFLAFVSSQN